MQWVHDHVQLYSNRSTVPVHDHVQLYSCTCTSTEYNCGELEFTAVPVHVYHTLQYSCTLPVCVGGLEAREISPQKLVLERGSRARRARELALAARAGYPQFLAQRAKTHGY